jgi:hypothetical protein
MLHFISYYAECHYAECCILFLIMLNVIMLCVVMLSVVMLSVVAPFSYLLSSFFQTYPCRNRKEENKHFFKINASSVSWQKNDNIKISTSSAKMIIMFAVFLCLQAQTKYLGREN